MPEFEEYAQMIKPLWDSRFLTNMGAYHKRLEKELQDYLKVPYVSLMVNGHMSLEMVIQQFDFPQGSEVITTPFSFVSTTHAIVRNGLTPVFCDIKETDCTIDETKIETLITEKTVAIVPVHVYGNICNVEAIQQIAEKHHLKVIYDAAHAFGEKYKGIGVANFGDASVFSFHATKVFHTIEGGAVCFSDKKIYDRLYNLKNFGIRSEELVAEVGANAKMNEFCAAMGLCNLRHIDASIADRKRVTEDYITNIQKLGLDKYFSIQSYNQEVSCNYGYFPIFFLTDDLRDIVFAKLREQDIYTRKYFSPIIPMQQCYSQFAEQSEWMVADKVQNRVLALPLYEGLKTYTVSNIVNLIKEICEEIM